MTAYLVASISVKNQEKWAEYTMASKTMIEEYGGSVLVLDRNPMTLIGEFGHSAQAILEFPTLEILQTWFNSDAYQKLTKIRDEGADVLFNVAQ